MRKRNGERFKHRDCTLQWRGRIAVAAFPDEGTGRRKRIELGVFPKDSQKAKDALVAFADRRHAVLEHAKKYTVGQLWAMWLKEREQDGYRNDIYEAQWVSLGPVFGGRVPHMLKTQDFRDYAKARFAASRSAWTVNTELVRLRACLKWADETDLIPKRPKVWVPSPGKHRKRVLTFEEAQALVAAASEGDPHVYVFTVVAFATGARHTAILDLTWPRVDFVAGIIEFDENLPPDPMSKAWRKGRATVPMNRSVRAVLDLAYRGRRCDHVVEHGGHRLKTVRNGFAAAVERAAKICPSLGADVTPHTIRHTIVTWLEERDVETRRTAQLVGHRDERTTKIYTHASPEVLKDAVQLLEEVFEALPRKHLEAPPKAASEGQKSAEMSAGDKSTKTSDANAGLENDA